MFSHSQALAGICKLGCLILVGMVALWFMAPAWLCLPVISAFSAINVGEPSSLCRSWQGTVWVMPEMETVLAPTAGIVTLLVQHGQWVVAGGVVAEISDGVSNPELAYAPRGGLVTLRMGHLSPDAGGGARPLRRDGDYVEMGAPVLGISQSSPLYLRLRGRPFGQLPLTGTEASVLADENGSRGSDAQQWLTASSYVYDGDGFSIKIDRFPETWLDKLTMEVAVRINGPKGHVVPKRAVLPGDTQGEALVWVVHQNKPQRRAVSVLDELDDKVVVEGLVSFEQVIRCPRIFRYYNPWEKEPVI